LGADQRILLVDDEPDILVIIRRTLERRGFHVDTFSDPEAAMARFEAAPQDYPLVISDIRMPSINGYRLAERVRVANPATRVILTSAYDVFEYEFPKELPRTCANEFISKPFTTGQICEAARRHFAPLTI
jgi:DNA-binding NtrC family response regulator